MPSSGLKLAIKISVVAGLTAGISIPFHHLGVDQPLQHVIYRELFFLPVILAAFWFGLRGGLAASVAISLIFVPVVLKYDPSMISRQTADIFEVVMFNVVGILLGLLRDRQLRQQEKTRQAQALAAVGQAVASVAHDMKTPLMAIGGFSNQVRRRLEDGDPAAHKLDMVISQTARLEEMVRGMLDFARPMDLNSDLVDLHNLTRECLEVAEPLAAQRQVRLRIEAEAAMQRLSLDSYRVQQALLNLVTNALQASPPGSQVTVCLCRRNREIHLEVRDLGEGIAPEHRAKVSHPFFTTKKDGTGLGLATARKIAEAHGGRLEMEDNHPRGMVFRLAFPISRRQGAAA